VIDLKSAKAVQTIKGLHEPQGVLFVSETKRLYVANGQGGDCLVYDADSLKSIQSIPFSDDADNMRYDASAKRLYVGFGDGGLGIIDVTTNKRIGEIKLAGHPESFQLEQKGNRIFVNIPDGNRVVVVDRDKEKIIVEWPIKAAKANFPMAL